MRKVSNVTDVTAPVGFRFCSCIGTNGVALTEEECSDPRWGTCVPGVDTLRAFEPFYEVSVEWNNSPLDMSGAGWWFAPGPFNLLPRELKWNWSKPDPATFPYRSVDPKELYGVLASAIGGHEAGPTDRDRDDFLRSSQRLFALPNYQLVKPQPSPLGSGCHGPGCYLWVDRWRAIFEPYEYRLDVPITKTLLGIRELAGLFVHRDGGVSDATGFLPPALLEVLARSGGKDWVVLSALEGPRSLAAVKSPHRAVAIPLAGSGLPILAFDMKGGKLVERKPVFQSEAFVMEPGWRALYSAVDDSLLVIGARDPDDASMVRKIDLSTGEEFAPSVFSHVPGEVLSAAYDRERQVVYVLQRGVEGKGESAELVLHSFRDLSSKLVWTVPFTGKVGSHLALFPDGKLALFAASERSYVVYQLFMDGDAGKFVGIGGKSGTVLDQPTTDLDGVLVPILGTSERVQVDLVSSMVHPEGATCERL